ncbi:MAG TPA: hypothetical protein VFK68_13655 [Propionibacteriaceae bacterium]|nr:hypothetical protein [Propionibacteriaceae bacterium]
MTTPPQSPGGDEPYVESWPLLPTDPPKIGDFWLDSRIVATPSGVTYLAHDAVGAVVMLVLLSAGAAEDAAARDRLAGQVNAMHIDTVVARGGQGQDEGRLAHKFRSEADDPVAVGQQPLAPWVALAYDGTPAAAAEAHRLLDEISLAHLPQQGTPSGPDYALHWIDRVQPGLSRLWPLPWPGRHDRAGRVSIVASWLLMILIAMLAILMAILMFSQSPPTQAPPPLPTTPPPSSQSGSPPPSASPSPQSASPSQQSASPSASSGSPSPSGSESPSGSTSPTPSTSGTPSPGGSESPAAGAPTSNPRL